MIMMMTDDDDDDDYSDDDRTMIIVMITMMLIINETSRVGNNRVCNDGIVVGRYPSWSIVGRSRLICVGDDDTGALDTSAGLDCDPIHVEVRSVVDIYSCGSSSGNLCTRYSGSGRTTYWKTRKESQQTK
jgi:hypothetical protein